MSYHVIMTVDVSYVCVFIIITTNVSITTMIKYPCCDYCCITIVSITVLCLSLLVTICYYYCVLSLLACCLLLLLPSAPESLLYRYCVLLYISLWCYFLIVLSAC